MNDRGVIPYCTDTTEDWVQAVDRAINATPFHRLPWTLSMECPHCRHPMTVIAEERLGLLGSADIDLDRYPTIPIACNCESHHPQTDDTDRCGAKSESAHGCGQHGVFVSPWKR